MDGGLIQMGAVSLQNSSMNLENYNTVESYKNIDLEGTIGFDKNVRFNIERHADTIKGLLFNIKMNPAPQGWHYKKSWYTHFFKNIELTIGGARIFSINSQLLQMEHLIHGETGPNELTFNYPTIEERMEKSRNAHEVIVEPLKLSKLIHSGLIRMITLPYQLVRIQITTGSLDDILEQDGTAIIVPIQEAHDTFIQSFKLNGLYQYLDTVPRRNMRTRVIYEDIIKQNCYMSKETRTNQRTIIRFNQYHICSALYIWVTDENNNEIPNQLVSNIKIKLNDHDIIDSSGLHCRHINKNNLPFPTAINDKSQNLYYISYFSGLNPENGAENGLNTTRIDNYTCEIDWVNDINMNVKIHFVHRSNNILRTQSGMAGLLYAGNLVSEARANFVPTPNTQGIAFNTQGIEFENTDQLIDIHCDELCMLTQETFEEGTMVDYCNQCNKAFTTELLQVWMSTKTDKKCVYCRNPYNTNTFKRGKVHLIQNLL
jgi:hypothetical protein